MVEVGSRLWVIGFRKHGILAERSEGNRLRNRRKDAWGKGRQNCKVCEDGVLALEEVPLVIADRLVVEFFKSAPSHLVGGKFMTADHWLLAAGSAKSVQSEKRPKEEFSFALAVAGKGSFGYRRFVGLEAGMESVFFGKGRSGKEEDAQGKKR